MIRRRRPPFEIGELSVRPGRRQNGELPIARLVNGASISLPVRVVHGTIDGPTIWLSAAVHGDEINGVEIVRRVIEQLDPRTMAGTLLAVPIVNVHGFLTGDRYLPDRRDLNRSFPGSPRGSLASRIAHLFMTEIVHRCELGVDLHTGSDHRTNLPQIRADLDDAPTRELAHDFGAPVLLHSRLRDGSLRAAAREVGARTLLYEAGEAWRFDRDAIEVGVAGVHRVMAAAGMVEPDPTDRPAASIECRDSSWVRARRSGIADVLVEPGDRVDAGQAIAIVRDSVGRRLTTTKAPRAGIVVGLTRQPLVNQGDAIAHLAVPEEPA